MSRELNSIDRILHCICRGPKFELKLSKWTAQPISDWPGRASGFIGPLARLLKKTIVIQMIISQKYKSTGGRNEMGSYNFFLVKLRF
jgi:hypothetical protein